jgi:hypothetical protein
MTRTQIQFPDPLYQRLKEIAEPLWNWAAKAKTGFRHIIDARLDKDADTIVDNPS